MPIPILKKMTEASKINTFCKNVEPVFIIGSTRSGTTLLARSIYLHSFFTPKVFHLAETLIMYHANMYHLCLKNTQFGDALRMFMGSQPYYKKFTDSVKYILRWHKFIQKPIVKKIVSKIPFFGYRLYHAWKINGNDKVVRNFFYYAFQARQAKRLLEKSPNNIFYYKEILSIFPKAQLLYIHRHPVDTYSSLRRRYKEEKHEWANTSPADFCKKYAQEIELLDQIKQNYPQQLYVVSYEKFTKQPKETILDLCQFLHIDFEEKMIQKHYVKALAVDKYLDEEINSKTKNWKEYISEQTAQFIEIELATVLKKLGYDFYTQKLT